MSYGITPAPGTCCPDRRYVKGICLGCGKIKKANDSSTDRVLEKIRRLILSGRCLDAEFAERIIINLEKQSIDSSDGAHIDHVKPIDNQMLISEQ